MSFRVFFDGRVGLNSIARAKFVFSGCTDNISYAQQGRNNVGTFSRDPRMKRNLFYVGIVTFIVVYICSQTKTIFFILQFFHDVFPRCSDVHVCFGFVERHAAAGFLVVFASGRGLRRFSFVFGRSPKITEFPRVNPIWDGPF